MKRKNKMAKEDIPNKLSINVSERNAPMTEAQFLTEPRIASESLKLILSKTLLSAAPVKKYEIKESRQG